MKNVLVIDNTYPNASIGYTLISIILELQSKGGIQFSDHVPQRSYTEFVTHECEAMV